MPSPTTMPSTAASESPTRSPGRALRMLLVSEVEGELPDPPRFDDQARLPSFKDEQISVRPGDHIGKTTNFYTPERSTGSTTIGGHGPPT